MTIDSTTSTIIAAFAATVICLAGIITCCIRRMRTQRRMTSRHSNSTAAYDELDQEEIEFKRMIETHGNSATADDDDDDDLFASGLEDISFNAKDKDRLSLLENLRNNLVAGIFICLE